MPPEFLSEEEVLKRWPMLTRGELRKARRANPPKIGFYAFAKKNGGPCYTVEQVEAYIDATYLRSSPSCRAQPERQPTASISPDIISTNRTQAEEGSGMLAGMTPALARSAAEVLAQRILKKPRSHSRKSSPAHRVQNRRNERPARTAF
jgi:hypothetical protein